MTRAYPMNPLPAYMLTAPGREEILAGTLTRLAAAGGGNCAGGAWIRRRGMRGGCRGIWEGGGRCWGGWRGCRWRPRAALNIARAVRPGTQLQLVFSTKDREPWLRDEGAPRVHAYLAAVCREATGIVYAVGGVEDHVHIATVLPRTLCIADLVEKVKVASSHWIKTLDPRFAGFHWQRGYGAFSTGPTGKKAMIEYVQNQVEHHKGPGETPGKTFQEEYRILLRKYECEWDERYVWD